jgi:hypothetical protein
VAAAERTTVRPRSARRGGRDAIGAGSATSPSRSRAFDLAVVLAFAALGVVLVLHHEPWRDEADTWLMARDAPLGELIRRTAYVGVPALWSFVLAPFARLGLPYGVIGFVNLAFAIAAIAIFTFRSPFPPLMRALIVFSFYLSYEYAVIARSYAISVLLLMTLAALDPRRLSRPLAYGVALALLFNTNVHGIMLGIPLAGLWAWEAIRSRPRARSVWIGLAVAAAGAVLALAQLLPPADGQLRGLAERAGPRWIPISLAGALFPTLEANRPVMAVSALILAAALVVSWSRRRAFVFLAVASAGLWAVFTLKYPGTLRHWGFLFLALIHTLWIVRAAEPSRDPPRTESPRGPIAAMAGMVLAVGWPFALAWSVYVAALHWHRDFVDPFSGSRAMARYLLDQGLVDVPIAAWPAPQAEAVLPHLPVRRFWYPGIRAYGSYMQWDRAYEEGMEIGDDEVLRRVGEEFPRDREVLLLANRPLAGADTAGFAMIHVVVGDVMMGDEQYVLYRRAASPRSGSAPSGPG